MASTAPTHPIHPVHPSSPTSPADPVEHPLTLRPTEAGDPRRLHAERDRATDALFERLVGLEETCDEAHRLTEEIFTLHAGLCDGMARRYANRGLEYDDLAQVARLALLKAIRRYRPGSGSSFAGFAVPTVSGELKRHFRDAGWVVRPTRRVQELRLALRARREAITHDLGRSPTAVELAEALGVTRDSLAEADATDFSFRPLSLDAPSPSGDENHIADGVSSPDPDIERMCDRVDLARALSRLSPHQRRVLFLRFVEERTQREIAELTGASQMQVSRLLARVLAELRPLVSDPRDPVARVAS